MPGDNKKKFEGFTEAERGAMKARAKELVAESKSDKNKVQGESDVLASIAAMSEPDKSMATRIHAIIKVNAPSLAPKTWYGMPAYANAEGKVICFFQNAGKFKARYATLGFNDGAKLDDGSMWPIAFALTKLTATEETKIANLVKQAVGT